ncbi:hypothetical protein FACS1894163_06650 [Spirochaetia bacterium]|nr:hypothetical protein FACS1894163_06650 [Spirochaetia bacterium]
MLKNYLRAALRESGIVVKELAAKTDVPKRTIDKWLEREQINPGVLDLYKAAKALNKTVEELVDGEAGAEYVRELVREAGGVWEPPKKLADIIEVLLKLHPQDIEMVRIMVNSILKARQE